jgi:hypothetical protein
MAMATKYPKIIKSGSITQILSNKLMIWGNKTGDTATNWQQK